MGTGVSTIEVGLMRKCFAGFWFDAYVWPHVRLSDELAQHVSLFVSLSSSRRVIIYYHRGPFFWHVRNNSNLFYYYYMY